jgi:citrate synthase
VYKVKDPRAGVLQKLVGQVFEKLGSTPLYDVAVELERTMEELVGSKGVYPNVDFYSGIVYEKLGIPSDIFTPIFAMARTAGWLAHWLEQLEDNRIFRPSQIYEGDKDMVYKPISER